jgi:hypothetical protein
VHINNVRAGIKRKPAAAALCKENLMDKRIFDFIYTWFSSDLNIEIEAIYVKNNKKAVLILESDVSYSNGQRSGGDLRTIDVPVETDDEIYERIKDLLSVQCNFKKVIEQLKGIEDRGFKFAL